METKIALSDIQSMFRSGLSEYYPEDEIRNIFYLATEHLLNYSKIDILLKSHESISEALTEKFHQMLIRLRNWEPIQYIIGYTSFYGLTFRVDKRVLIPRPETEEMVQWIIRNETGSALNLIDLGTGSGCIAVSLAMNLPGTRVSACDISPGALEIARMNSEMHKAKVNLFVFDMLDDGITLPGKYHVMVSNPPYVRQSETAYMRRNVLDHEPGIALFVPDKDAFIYYRSIALLGRKHLSEGGTLYLEINENFPHEMVKLLESTGFYGVEIKRDLNGKARMVRARK